MSQPPPTVTTEKTDKVIFELVLFDGSVVLRTDVTAWPHARRRLLAEDLLEKAATYTGAVARYVSTTTTVRTKVQELTAL